MPFRHPATVRDLILQRVAAGEPLKWIAAEPGMPCPESVTGWARRDPAFAAAYERAKAQGAWRRTLMFDEAKARRLLARLAAGETIGRVLADPAMPSPRTYRYWRATYGEFAEAVGRLNAVKTAEKAARARRRTRAYDAGLADKILYRVGQGGRLRRVLSADPALPCLAVLARWRREQPQFDRDLRVCMTVAQLRRAGTRLYSAELVEEICGRIAEGATFRSLAADPAMPCLRTLCNWRRTKPAFAEAVASACRWRDDWWADQALDIASRATAATVDQARRRIGALRCKAARLRGMWAGEADDETAD